MWALCNSILLFLSGYFNDPYSLFSSTIVRQNLVISTKSVEYMPFYLSLSMFLMSVSFFVYGVLLHDFFIYVRFKFPIVGCSFCFEGCLTVCLLVLLILVCFSISDSKRDWNHIGCHTAVAVCLLQKRIKRGRQAAIASHTYMSMPKNKVRQTIYCYLALCSFFFSGLRLPLCHNF